MSILSRIFFPEQINLKLLETVKSDLEKAKKALELDQPDVRAAKHSIELAEIVINILLKKKEDEPKG